MTPIEHEIVAAIMGAAVGAVIGFLIAEHEYKKVLRDDDDDDSDFYDRA